MTVRTHSAAIQKMVRTLRNAQRSGVLLSFMIQCTYTEVYKDTWLADPSLPAKDVFVDKAYQIRTIMHCQHRV